jgi:hypothetical protein
MAQGRTDHVRLADFQQAAVQARRGAHVQPAGQDAFVAQALSTHSRITDQMCSRPSRISLERQARSLASISWLTRSCAACTGQQFRRRWKNVGNTTSLPAGVAAFAARR